MTSSANCISSLADANIAMVGQATIELCPGTYAVGAPLDDTLTSFVGGIPLIIDAEDVTIKCGISGASSNGCILEGGVFQLFMLGDPNTGSVGNLNFQGITFTGAMESTSNLIPGSTEAPRNIFGASGGSVIFTDCLFKDITTTGHVMQFLPADAGNIMTVTIVNSAFTNVAHAFDAIYADVSTFMTFNTVAFTNMTHILPEDNVDKCTNFTAATCGYTSSIIHEKEFVLADTMFVDVNVTNSTFYTAILQTLDNWGFGSLYPFTTLITVKDTAIYNQGNRTANDDYCEGGYAAAYNETTGIDWQCKRVNYDLNVVEILRCGINCDANGNFSTLFELLEATGLDASIPSNTNEVTIFAPTDEAFEQLPPGMLDTLLADEEGIKTLTELLLYHVTSEDPVTTEAIAFGLPAALTVQGESVSFTPPIFLGGREYYMVDDAAIIHEDWEESPGSGKVIQVIDRVIAPSTIPILRSFAELVESLGLTELIDVAQGVGFEPNLDIGKTYTFFAPSNGAIKNSTSTQALLTASNKAALTTLLNHHFVEGNFSIADLQASSCLDKTSLASKNIKITFSNSEIKWNDAFTNSSEVNQLTYNGILHVVDGVLNPDDIKRCTSAASGRASVSVAIGLAGTIVALFVF